MKLRTVLVGLVLNVALVGAAQGQDNGMLAGIDTLEVDIGLSVKDEDVTTVGVSQETIWNFAYLELQRNLPKLEVRHISTGYVPVMRFSFVVLSTSQYGGTKYSLRADLDVIRYGIMLDSYTMDYLPLSGYSCWEVKGSLNVNVDNPSDTIRKKVREYVEAFAVQWLKDNPEGKN